MVVERFHLALHNSSLTILQTNILTMTALLLMTKALNEMAVVAISRTHKVKKKKKNFFKGNKELTETFK